MNKVAQNDVDDDHTEAWLDVDSCVTGRVEAFPDCAAELIAAAVGCGALTAIGCGYYRAWPVAAEFAGSLARMDLLLLCRRCCCCLNTYSMVEKTSFC